MAWKIFVYRWLSHFNESMFGSHRRCLDGFLGFLRSKPTELGLNGNVFLLAAFVHHIPQIVPLGPWRKGSSAICSKVWMLCHIIWWKKQTHWVKELSMCNRTWLSAIPSVQCDAGCRTWIRTWQGRKSGINWVKLIILSSTIPTNHYKWIYIYIKMGCNYHPPMVDVYLLEFTTWILTQAKARCCRVFNTA